ncbi:GmrSD restriction endonuclease domain-containing protein [Myroides sp. TSA_177.3]|uniref:GmrSD restriction endonuclease domain-containing protein n=1 Tax=Myroides sp. TSA_177.3 TaxID=3415650 RepID=UPI004045E5EB
MSIQEIYRQYSDKKFLVNRKYQRKLVWTVDEKEYLIDSIISDFPIPLILFAKTQDDKFEIIDGLQRLNAIISFVENRFSVDGKFFDVNQSSRAKQNCDKKLFDAVTDFSLLLDPQTCANFLDYQLAITVYPNSNENIITDIFGRINSGGKQLSPQEKRQAGMIDNFSDLIRKISSEIRGDSSNDLLELSDMPEISIDSTRENIGYGLIAEDIFWCKNGVIWKKQLRDSEDEEMIVDIVSSILKDEPLAKSRDLFNKIYDENSDVHKELNKELIIYGAERITHEIKVVFSILEEIFDSQNTTIIDITNPKSRNPVKESFYSIFMALFTLIVKEEKSPAEKDKIVNALQYLQKKMTSTANYSVTADREKNIDLTYGLIHKFFVKKDPPVLKHGAGLALDFENSIRRSKIESNRYECKQGFFDLSTKRKLNQKLYKEIIDTICGIANVGPEEDGFLFFGVADKQSDAETIKKLDSIVFRTINDRYIVGIDRELKIEKWSLDDYVNKLLGEIDKSELSEPLKSQVKSQIDIIDYKGMSIIRIRIPKQSEISFVGKKSFIRENSKTIEMDAPRLLAISKLFK